MTDEIRRLQCEIGNLRDELAEKRANHKTALRDLADVQVALENTRQALSQTRQQLRHAENVTENLQAKIEEEKEKNLKLEARLAKATERLAARERKAP